MTLVLGIDPGTATTGYGLGMQPGGRHLGISCFWHLSNYPGW